MVLAEVFHEDLRDNANLLTLTTTTQARTQPVSKGGYIVVERGGGGGGITHLIVYFNNSYAVLSPPREVWGMLPQKIRLPESISEAF